MISASAPGKIILFGEHAVVYGRPALAVPVTQVQATATVEESPGTGTWIDAPDVGKAGELYQFDPEEPLAAVIRSVLQVLSIQSPPSLKITVNSTIPVASGLGSGAAVSVAIIRALSAYLGQPLTDGQVNTLAFEIEKLHHGTPSGIDNTVVTYARPVWFVKGQTPETFQVGAPFILVIGDSGHPSPTRIAVGDLRRLWEADPGRWENVFGKVGIIAENARQAINAGNIEAIGSLMDQNHVLLQEMTISSKELDQLTRAAKEAGALGAKLSGGGRGGNMIALVQPEKVRQVSDALLEAGAHSVLVTTIE